MINETILNSQTETASNTYESNAEVKGFVWMERHYDSLGELGLEMLLKLWKKDSSDYQYWDSILVNKAVTSYLAKTDSDNTEMISACSAIEASHNTEGMSERDAMMNYYSLAYLLSGKKLFVAGDKEISSPSELSAYMKELFDSSYECFEKFCYTLIDYNDTLDVQLEAWLMALGKVDELEAWRNSLNS